MKKLLFLWLLVLFLFPIGVLAKEKVNVYFFRGEGCSHCAAAEEFFDSLPLEEKEKINLVSYEVWYDSENSALMSYISDFRGDDANGVPYMIIGDQYWVGYSNKYDDAILKQIDKVYLQDPSNRYDAMKAFEPYRSLYEEKDEYKEEEDPYDEDEYDDYDDEEDEYEYDEEEDSDKEDGIHPYFKSVGFAKVLILGIILFFLFGIGGIVGIVFLVIYLIKKDKKK